MAKHRNHSIEFKRQIAQQFIAGETLHGLAKQHDLSRNLIRVWVARYEAGAFDDSFTGTYRFSVSGSATQTDDFRDSLTDTGVFGSVVVNVTAGDGKASNTKSFTLTVTNVTTGATFTTTKTLSASKTSAEWVAEAPGEFVTRFQQTTPPVMATSSPPTTPASIAPSANPIME